MFAVKYSLMVKNKFEIMDQANAIKLADGITKFDIRYRINDMNPKTIVRTLLFSNDSELINRFNIKV